MATYPLATDIAWRVIEQFIKDWQQSPNSWIKEIEIQAEIYSRIKQTFRLMNYDKLEANYSKNSDKEFWSRIALEPKIYYPDGGVCRPDIVIWDELDNPNEPTDNKEIGGNFPIQLAIEIKTNFKNRSNAKSHDNSDIPDIGKLKSLLRSNKDGNEAKFRTIRYGAWLNFHYQDGNENAIPERTNVELPIWEYVIYSNRVYPSLKRKSKG